MRYFNQVVDVKVILVTPDSGTFSNTGGISQIDDPAQISIVFRSGFKNLNLQILKSQIPGVHFPACRKIVYEIIQPP